MTEQPPYPGPTSAPSASEARTWAALAHLGGILTYLWVGWVASLVVWLVFKDRSPGVADEAKVALNFQLTMLIGIVVFWVVGHLPLLGWLGTLGQVVIGLASLVRAIMAFLAVQRGGRFTYPFALALVR